MSSSRKFHSIGCSVISLSSDYGPVRPDVIDGIPCFRQAPTCRLGWPEECQAAESCSNEFACALSSRLQMQQLCCSRQAQAMLVRQGKQGMVRASRQGSEACELERKHPQTCSGES